jgi:hypothetical protein
MRNKLNSILRGLIGLLVISAPVFAHHGYAAYDMTTTQLIKGTIVNLLLLNPHSSVEFDVKAADGTVEHWFSESANPRNMKLAGFTPDSIKPGDQVTIYYHPSKSGAHVVVLTKVEFADGRVLSMRD